jgi:cytochrome c-type biogenesis protein
MLTGVLVLASQDGKLVKAALYLVVYSLGLGLPFILASVFLQFFAAKLLTFSKALGVIQKISGILLVALGLLLIAGRFNWLTIFFQRLGFGAFL